MSDINQVWTKVTSLSFCLSKAPVEVKMLTHCALLPHEQMLHTSVQYMLMKVGKYKPRYKCMLLLKLLMLMAKILNEDLLPF